MNSLLGYEQAKLVDCDNKRFLSFVQHCKKQNEDKKTLASDSMMVPTGDYVVLEAKEMLKHFNLQDGMPKKSQKDLTVVKPVRKTSIRDWISEKDLKSSLKWPEILLTDYHDLYYNRTGKSFSEALILASTNPQYDKKLSIDLPVQYMKLKSSEHVVYIIFSNFSCRFLNPNNFFQFEL